MIILIYACAALGMQPNWCSTHSILVPAEQVTIRACALSQVHVAKWSIDNPGWQVKRWDCKRFEVAEMVR